MNVDTTTDELIIKTALEKRQQLKRNYNEENSDVNPLVLVQLPDSRKGRLDRKDQIIEMLDSRFGISTGNGKLAIYLSDKDNKVNLENIEKNTNEVEVLIFKQAITVGWDCPRSSILILFREWKKIEFSIQTIGRIIRIGNLNFLNVCINIGMIQLIISIVFYFRHDVTRDYITIYESIRRNEFNDPVDLESIYIKRQHKKTRLNSDFRKIFSTITNKQHLIDKISLDIPNLKNKILTDAEITQLDKEQNLQGGLLSIKLSPMDLQNRFDSFTSEMSEPFAKVVSHGVIKRCIFQFFKDNTDINDLMDMEMITLSSKNKDHFIKIISKAKE